MSPLGSPKSRIRCLPMEHAAAEPLRSRHVVAGLLGRVVGPYQDGAPMPVNHRLVYALRGRIHLAISDGPAFIEEGELWVLPADVPWRYWLKKGESWEAFWIRLQDVDAWEHLRFEQAHRRFEGQSERIRHVMEGFIDEANSPQPDAYEVARLYAGILGAYIERRLSIRNSEGDRSTRYRMEELWRAVQDDISRPWTTAEMARLVHLSEPHFYRVVRKLHFCTPGEMLLHLRMDRAKALLLASDAKLESVAEGVGYASAFSFAKAFKKHTGAAPGRFRRDTARLV